MAKRYHQKYQKHRAQDESLSISNEGDYDFDSATSQFESPTTINNYWIADSTKIDNDNNGDGDEQREEKPNIANSWAGLIDKYLQGKAVIRFSPIIQLSLIVWLGVCSWVFISDNEKGYLNTQDGLTWYGIKAAFLLVIVLIILIVLFINSLIYQSSLKKRELKKTA